MARVTSRGLCEYDFRPWYNPRMGKIILALFILVDAHQVCFAGNLVPMSEVPGKTSDFRINLPERSPLSSPKEIQARFRLKPEELGEDYDLSKMPFDVYIP